jgi:SAM-dependent methyltransferase
MTVFDKYADNYDEGHVKAVAISGFKPSHFHEYKLKEVLKYLKENGLANKNIKFLDFGCGTGSSVKYIKKYLPNASVYGVDVSKEEIRVAKKDTKNLKDVTFASFDGTNIPFNVKFDVIFIANVFHHIRRDKHKKVMKNIYTKLAKNGYLFIFELNPLNPLTLFVMYKNDFKFDKSANALIPFYTKKLLSSVGFSNIKVTYTIFFPQFLSILMPLEKYLRWLPLGAHYFYVAKKS